jgi:DNA-binding transcriptional MerR regulator
MKTQAKHEEPFDVTTGEMARLASVLPDTVRHYSDMELIESRRLSNGSRVFRRSAVAVVQALKAQRLANRGGKRRAG